MRAPAWLAVAAAVLCARSAGAHSLGRRAVDWSAEAALADLPGCDSSPPGSAQPMVDRAATNMTRQDIAVAAWSRQVTGRKATMYLGSDPTKAQCLAAKVANADSCRNDLVIKGTWRQLRTCGWTPPDTASRAGYEVRNNTVYLEWQDRFPDGRRAASRYSYPVSIAFPTTVNVQTDIKVLEESGIKNFNLTGVTFDNSNNQRLLLLDFNMFSRWPNNLTLDADSGYIQVPGYRGKVSIVNYVLPTCLRTSTGGTAGPFSTDDFCYQSGTLAIDIGNQCEVGGAYAFNFDTNCFPGAANTQDCSGKVLTANALVGTANAQGTLVLNLCSALYNTVASVTGTMSADKPQGYFFGDTVLLTAEFNSPDLPIYEARLTNLILGRNAVQRTPNLGAATNVTRNVNTTLVDSPAGPAGLGALTTLAVNTNFTYLPTADPNVVQMKITPNMLPATAGLDVNEDSFLTTDDFDSITDYTFYASFRIYFDSVSSSGQRRRRLLARDIRVPAPALRQSSRVSTDAQAALTVPPNPELPPAATTAAAPGTTATPSRVPGQLTPEEQAAIAAAQTRVVIIASVGATTSLLFLVVVAAIVFLLIARRRRSRKRNNDDGMEEKLVPPEWKDGYDKGPEGYYGGGMLAPDYAAPSGILYAGQQGMTPAGMRYY